MRKYKTPEEKRETVIQWHNKRREDLNYIKRELGYRVTFPKPINTVSERIRQEKITELWKLYGWFMDVENNDTRESVEEQEEYEDDFIADGELDIDEGSIEEFFGEK